MNVSIFSLKTLCSSRGCKCGDGHVALLIAQPHVGYMTQRGEKGGQRTKCEGEMGVLWVQVTHQV